MGKQDLVRAQEVQDLADWCDFVARTEFDFVMNKRLLADAQFFKSMLEQKLEAIASARVRGDLKGLRMIYRDTSEMMRGLSSQDRKELDKMLLQRFGRGLVKSKRDLQKDAEQILNRGKINEAEEYRILDTWRTMISQDPSMAGEVRRVDILLATVRKQLPE